MDSFDLTPFANAYLHIERQQCEQLRALDYGPNVTHVYSPVEYASQTHELFVRKFCRGPKDVLFLGMNPGPFGMVQNGVPFGDTVHVRNWMRIEGEVGRPEKEHPKRRVLGLNCTRSEVSGRRFWGLFSSLCPSPEGFFARCFVHNYCPLAFLASSGANLPLIRLPQPARRQMQAICDEAFVRVLDVLRPRLVVGVGRYARDCAVRALGEQPRLIQVSSMTHPSPASPKANGGWTELALGELRALGVLSYFNGS